MQTTTPITAIFFSCKRIELLNQTIKGFETFNTYPIEETIIVNDSADEKIHDQLKQLYPSYTLVLNKENVGLIKSIDIGYSHIKTEYFFHCEDDWMPIKSGFLEKSLVIMEERKDIEEVWLKDYNRHPMEEEILEIGNVKYRLAAKNHSSSWYGFTTACGLKRISDYKKVAPYSDIAVKCVQTIPKATIWHREQAIGIEYNKLGYRTAILIDDEYATNIGIGLSEYVTGFEI